MRGYGESDGYYNITRQVLPGEFEIAPQACAIIVHYAIQVDVLDSQYNLVANRTKQKQITITFSGLTPSSDIEEIADSLIGQSDFLPETKRAALLKCLNDLRNQIKGTPAAMPSSTSQPLSKKPSTPPTSTAPKSESAPQLALTLSKAEVDNLLHDALQKIHWGDDQECYKTLLSLVQIAQYDRNLQLIIQHEPLMNTLINGLKKYAASSLASCICIMEIFEKMSYFRNYQENLARFKIGAMSLSLLHAQVALTNVADQNLDKVKLREYLKSQNTLLKLVVSLLFNLGENPSAMRKMVNKDIVTPLRILLKRKSAELVIISLQFLRRIANVNVNWSDIPYDEIIESVVQNVFRWNPDATDEGRNKIIGILKEGIELLFTFSFHSETIDEMKSKGVFESLSKLCKIGELRNQMVKFFYNCSQAEDSDEAFRNEDLLNLLIASTTSNCEERMIALVILMKLSMDKECALTIAKSPVFTTQNLKTMFVQATQKQTNENKILLKLIRNVADNQPDLVSGFDGEIITACVGNASNQDALCDIFAVSSRAKMTSDRAKFFTGDKKFVKLILQILSNQRSIAQLHLECVMFVSSVVLYSAPAGVLGKENIVDRIVDVFMWHEDDIDMETQCLFAFYHFICHTATRNALISHQEIVDKIIQDSASKNHVLKSIANSVLEALVTFDKEWSDKIRRPRFIAFNQEWLQAID